MKKIIIFTLGAVLVLWGCSKAVEIKGAEKDEIIKLAAPVTDRILEGFNTGDYKLYSTDFDEKMKNTLTEKVFKQTREQIIGKIGKYESRKFTALLKKGPYYIVKYRAAFKKEKKVTVKVVLMKYKTKYLVSGLWFNSPKLMK